MILSSTTLFGQSRNENKRTIKGLVWDEVSNSTAIGSNILQYRTMNGAVIQSDGIFELEVPKGDTVLIHIPFCFDSFYVMYLPTDNYKKIILSKKLKRQSKRTLDFWEKRRKT